MAADLGTGFINVLPRTSAFGPTLIGRIRPLLDSLESSTGLAFSNMELAGVAAFVGIGAASLKAATQFESSMAKIQGLVGLSSDAIGQLHDDVLNLATEVPVGPQELADALYFIESAGLRGDRAMEALTESAKAAAAGLGSTKDIADVVTSAMNSYAQSGLTATQATDVLVAAVREGKTDPATFAKNIGQVLPVAAQLGITFDQVAAAIASSTREGLQAGRAATGIRYLLGAMIRPSDQAEQALAGVGITLESLSASLRNRGLLPTLQELSDRFDISTAAGRKLFATVVGGIRGMSTAAILVGQNAKDVEEIFKNVANSAGETEQAFQIRQQTLGNQLKQLGAIAQVVGIDIGEQLLGPAKDLVNVLAFVGRNVVPLVGSLDELAQVLGSYYVLGKVAAVLTRIGDSGKAAAVGVGAEAEAAAAGVGSNEALAAAKIRAAIAVGVLEKALIPVPALIGAEAGAAGEASIANEELAASSATATGGVSKLGAGLLASRGWLAALIAWGIGFHKVLDVAFESAQDLGNEFQITGDQAQALIDRTSVNRGGIGFGTGGGGGGFFHALADPFGQLGASTDEATAKYQEISQAAQEAGISQDIVNQAYANTSSILNANRASIEPWANAFQGQIVALNSVQLATDGYVTVQERATAANVLGLHAAQAYGAVLDASPHGLRAGSKALEENTGAIEQNSIAYEHLSGQQQLLIDYGQQIVQGYAKVGPLFEAMGTNMASFQAEAQKALETGKWDDFASTVMGNAADAIQQFHDTAVQNLSFVDDELQKLGDHPTAQGIIDSFRKAGTESKSFAGDLTEIRNVLGGKGKSLAAYFLETGNAAAAAAIASASPEQQKQAVRLYSQQRNTVEKLASTLTSKLLPTLRDMNKLLEAIAGQYDVSMNLQDNASGPLNRLQAHLETIDGNVYSVTTDYYIHRIITGPKGIDPRTGDTIIGTGGIIHGATGFLTRSPTYLVGEGQYATPAGRGAEAVIPLGSRGQKILADAIMQGTGNQLVKAMLSALSEYDVKRSLRTEVGAKRTNDILDDMRKTLIRTGSLDLSEAYAVFRKSTTAAEANSWRGLQRDAFRDAAGRMVRGQGIRDLRGAVATFATKKEADDLILQLKQGFRKTGHFDYARVREELQGEVSPKEMHRILERLHKQLDDQEKRDRDRRDRPQPIVGHLKLTPDSDAYVDGRIHKRVNGRYVDRRLGREFQRRTT